MAALKGNGALVFGSRGGMHVWRMGVGVPNRLCFWVQATSPVQPLLRLRNASCGEALQATVHGEQREHETKRCMGVLHRFCGVWSMVEKLTSRR